ncbi:MAG: hypothetical protein Q8Q02_00080 [Nocardioides sp.]|nr:hypothetical protein [Nocardioides sp.]
MLHPSEHPLALTAVLRRHGLTVLPASERVPVLLWLRRDTDPTSVLRMAARGTRVTLEEHDPSSFTTLELRAACDCAEHRSAGTRARTVLVPGVLPRRTAVVDGRERYGWTGVTAGRLDLAGVAPLLDGLVADLDAGLPNVPALAATG